MFPTFIKDHHESALMEAACQNELWLWREAKQWFIACRDAGQLSRADWRGLSRRLDALKAAYGRAVLSAAMMSAAA